MPPKRRGAEPRIEEDSELTVEVEGESSAADFVSHSPASSHSSARSCGSLSSAQLERILDANTKSMMALMDRRCASPDHLPVGTGIGSRVLQTRVDIPKWVEGESPSDFFGKYEQALSHNGVDRSKWGSLLQVYISGSAQASFKQLNPVVHCDYDLVKKEMLESLGDTPDGADKRWFTLSRQRGENHRALFRRVHNTGYRRMDGLESKEACCDRMVLSKFLTLLSPDCYASVAALRPKNGQEAARLAQKYEEDASFARSLHPKASGGHYHKREYSNNMVHQQDGASSPSKPKSGSGYQGTNSSPSPVQGQGGSGSGEKPFKQAKPYKKERGPIVCYGCGEPGHIRPNCPNKVRRVKSPVLRNAMVVSGWLAGSPVENLRVDTGADRTIVRQDFIPEGSYTDESVRLDSWRGAQHSDHKVASIVIKVGEVERIAKVAVVEHLDCPALLGSITMTKELMRRVVAQLDDSDSVVESESVRVTRAQAKKDVAREREDDLASAQAECVPQSLGDIFDIPDEYFEQDIVVEPVDELSEWPVLGEADMPLPNVKGCDSACLKKEQEEDSTLKKVLILGQNKQKGYAFEKGVLVHFNSDEVDESVMRVVVPVGRRLQVLQVAHSGIASGHFGFLLELVGTFCGPRCGVRLRSMLGLVWGVRRQLGRIRPGLLCSPSPVWVSHLRRWHSTWLAPYLGPLQVTSTF